MRRAQPLGVALAAAASALVLGGCGLPFARASVPARPSTVTTSRGAAAAVTPSARRLRATVARARRTHEIPTPAPPQRARGGWRSPVQAVQVFAQAYINWTADTVAAHLRVLSQAAIGQARSAMALAAGQVGRDSSLRLGGIANSGTVEAIAPVTGERNVYAVVTRERTTATNTRAYQGLRPAWHVTLATVTEVDGWLWTISGWQPEN
jgi:hypothetical protein